MNKVNKPNIILKRLLTIKKVIDRLILSEKDENCKVKGINIGF